MKEKPLQPIILSSKFDELLEAEIMKFLTGVIFAPVAKEMQETFLFNAKSVLEDAIRSGRIHFSQGIFKGNFNANITKEFRKLGLKFDARIAGYRKELGKLPQSIQIAIVQTESKFELMAANMKVAVDAIDIDGTLEGLDFTANFSSVVDAVDKDYDKTVKRPIGITVDLLDDEKDLIAERFSENLKLTIKKFSDEQILALRKDIDNVVFQGIRAESLQKSLQERFSISASKAKFLASQEIKLFTSKYKQIRYENAGIRKYKWSTSKDSRVRPDHKDLDGKIFFFDQPPVENKDTGDRANPGEPFGCRCIAIPIIDV